MKEQGYIFKSSEINAENLAASQDSRNSGFTFFIHCTMPDIERISPLQRPHYFTSSYTYLFSKKVILLSFLG